MAIQREVLKWLFKDLWKNNKSCYICYEKINYDYNRENFQSKHRMLLLAFLLRRKEVTMAEQKTIYCPKCGRKVGIWDGKSTMDLYFRCKKCKKQVVYHSCNGVLEMKKLPQRNTSSGMSFC